MVRECRSRDRSFSSASPSTPRRTHIHLASLAEAPWPDIPSPHPCTADPTDCGAAPYGDVEEGPTVLFVDMSAPSGGHGTKDAPYPTIQQALRLGSTLALFLLRPARNGRCTSVDPIFCSDVTLLRLRRKSGRPTHIASPRTRARYGKGLKSSLGACRSIRDPAPLDLALGSRG